jgi:hypothetical protein
MKLRERQRPASVRHVLIVLAAACAGCASERMPVEQVPGQAARMAFSLQIAHPDAALNASTSQDGLDGAAAKASIDRYIRSFELPAPTSNLFTIGVGTGSGGSTASPGVTVPAAKR